ncbi:PRC-barrel domain-containing protein [Paracoccus bogoriensis]|uniref:PRC-barrel domain-containing protein n=1 Tax=Paracoccus bogoriensis TaxID=242065 RepID=UPI001C662A18|nr:PRC-barrel domain-containing protein [Paracoccus bogoriensis]MBW7055084.1 PRC-barrel domain-containing protein [Paracoccus bogoriensis]
MDHANHPRLTPDEMTEAVLTGAPIYDPEGQTVGTIADTHGAGPDMSVVVDVGGILGIGSKPVLVPLRDLDMMRDENGDVHGLTRHTKDELKRLPEHRQG